MTITLNTDAEAFARELIDNGKVVRDTRDEWSEAAPDTKAENTFISENGFESYAKWHLGVDDDAPADTKKRYSFPFGDFQKVRRGGVISLESRAAQNDHHEIAEASRKLLELIDAGDEH
jgi:hypothetical protein